MYIAVLGQLGLTDQKSVGFSERVGSNCPVGSSLKRSEIPTTSRSFVQDERKPTPRRKELVYFSSDAKGSQKIIVALVT